MSKLLFLKATFVFLIANVSTASAQFPNENGTICYMSQQAFSIGSTFRSDAELLQCVRSENGAVWEVLDDARPKSCMHNNTYYSPGALLETASGNKTIACQKNGIWQPVTDAKE